MSEIKLYHGDCLEVMGEVADKSVDLILTDPPYELDTHGGGNRKQWKNIHNNFIKDLSYGFNYNLIFEEFLRVCKIPNILIFCSNKQISKIMSWFENKKLSVTLLCWYKEGYVPFANGKYKSDGASSPSTSYIIAEDTASSIEYTTLATPSNIA